MRESGSSRLFRLPRLRRLPLAVEIALALLIKLCVLFWLWHTFFSAPQTKKMRMPTAQVEQHLLSPLPIVPVVPPHSPLPEAIHEPNR
jgi:hypothetical protein